MKNILLVLVLIWTLNAAGELAQAETSARARPIQADAAPFVLFQTLPAAAPADEPEPREKKDRTADKIVLTYTLRFLRDTLPSAASTDTGAGSGAGDIAGIGTDSAATDLAAFLSAVYPAGDTVVTAHENHLVLVGPRDHVNTLRQMLALTLDVPSPQVKADIYTIQVNTTPQNRDATQDKIEEIAAGVQIVRDFIHGSQDSLGAYVASPQANAALDPEASPDALKQKLFAKMALAGYDPSPRRPLGLMDMLIFLTVSDRKQLRAELTPGLRPDPAHPTLVDRLEFALNQTRRQLAAGEVPLTSPAYQAPDVSVYSRHNAQLVKLIDRIESQVQIARQTPAPLFSRLAALYPDNPQAREGEINGICNFLDAWHDCQGAFEKMPGDPNADPAHLDPQEYPDRLSRQSAATDLMLKEAMDALTADLQAVYFQPLLDWIRDDVRGAHAGDTGIDLVGTTSITVRDRTLGVTAGTAESFFPFTPIPHLTMNSLGSGAAPAAGGATGAAAPSPATVMGALTPLQTLALQSAFNEDAVVPSYRRVAPGTSLAIRPFVLPDGGSARVQMSLSSAMKSDPPSADQLANRDLPFDSITCHTVTTEATISAFDLQTIASFGAQTTAPGDYAWRIPLLDQLPLLGALFHGPRSAATKRQDSIVILNLTILPRSLDLVPYYVASPDAP